MEATSRFVLLLEETHPPFLAAKIAVIFPTNSRLAKGFSLEECASQQAIVLALIGSDQGGVLLLRTVLPHGHSHRSKEQREHLPGEAAGRTREQPPVSPPTCDLSTAAVSSFHLSRG